MYHFVVDLYVGYFDTYWYKKMNIKHRKRQSGYSAIKTAPKPMTL